MRRKSNINEEKLEYRSKQKVLERRNTNGWETMRFKILSIREMKIKTALKFMLSQPKWPTSIP